MKLFAIIPMHRPYKKMVSGPIIQSWVAMRCDWKRLRVIWPWRKHHYGIGWEWPLKFYTLSSRRFTLDLGGAVIPGRGAPRCRDCNGIIGSCDCISKIGC